MLHREITIFTVMPLAVSPYYLIKLKPHKAGHVNAIVTFFY